MAATIGNTGSITFPTVTDLVATTGANSLLCYRWSGSITRDMHDVTAFAPTSMARSTLGGLHVMTGTCEGFLDDTVAHTYSVSMAQAAAIASAVLTADTGHTYTFDCFISDWSVTVDVNAVNVWSCSFQSSGAIAIAHA